MLEWIFIALLCVGVLLFFHNQATYEFKIAQIDWDQRSLLPSLLEERGPLVLQNLPPVAFWTQQDVLMRDGYGYVPVFEDQSIAEWLQSEAATTGCDLIVMGLYGHTRMREFVLGGVSRGMLLAPSLPLLVSH